MKKKEAERTQGRGVRSSPPLRPLSSQGSVSQAVRCRIILFIKQRDKPPHRREVGNDPRAGVEGGGAAAARRTHRDALPHDAALLHPPGAAELLHVLAEVALSALGPQAGLALAASRPAPASSRRCPVGGQLHRGGRAQLPLGPPYRPVLRKNTQDWWGARLRGRPDPQHTAGQAELCLPKDAAVSTPGPQNGTLFANSVFTEVTKLKPRHYGRP